MIKYNIKLFNKQTKHKLITFYFTINCLCI